MDIIVDHHTYVIFDLDDTLYLERDFVRSGFQHIDELLKAVTGRSITREIMGRFNRGENVFEWLLDAFPMLKSYGLAWLLHEYRTHRPTISLGPGALALLERLHALDIPIGILTDGRSVTQRNKIEALGLHRYLTDIVISEEIGSEKPDERNYRYFTEKYPYHSFVAIGDNTGKDFVVPAQLQWMTICLRCSGSNIHPQDLEASPRPDYVVSSLSEIDVRFDTSLRSR